MQTGMEKGHKSEHPWTGSVTPRLSRDHHRHRIVRGQSVSRIPTTVALAIPPRLQTLALGPRLGLEAVVVEVLGAVGSQMPLHPDQMVGCPPPTPKELPLPIGLIDMSQRDLRLRDLDGVPTKPAIQISARRRQLWVRLRQVVSTQIACDK